MASELIHTKILIPRTREKLVLRERLYGCLEAGLRGDLILVSAPAGFGKSTLISSWLDQKHITSTWYSVDQEDNDIRLFWSYFITAIQKKIPNIGRKFIFAINSSKTLNYNEFIIGLINELEELKVNYLLVLDDYHMINNQQIHETMLFLLEHIPLNFNLVISTRSDPPWPLARIRARNRLVEIRAEDLRFTEMECYSFLRDVMELDISPEECATLDKRIEGWIAGLQMAALSMRGQEDKNEFIKDFAGSHRFILDYLLEEVINQQPREIQDFLLKTSILDQMSGSLCDAVLDSNESQQTLLLLEQENLFVFPLDEERLWYRYHHLFRELLQSQLHRIYPDQILVLHQRASQWFESQDSIENAVNHAMLAQDFDSIAHLVEKNALKMMRQNEYSLLSEWIEALPEESIHQSPWLCVYQSWTRHWAGIREKGEDCLGIAEKKLIDFEENERNSLLGYISTVRAHYALVNEQLSRVKKFAEEALKLLPEDDYHARGTVGVALGGAYWGLGDVDQAEVAFRECVNAALKGGNYYRASSGLCYVGMQQVKKAKLLNAKQTFTQALHLAEEPEGLQHPVAGYALGKLSELACEWNDLEQAYLYAEKSIKLCRQLGHVDVIAESYVALARVHLAREEYEHMDDVLREAERLTLKTKLDPWALSWLDGCRIHRWLSTGDLEEAARWLEMKGYSGSEKIDFHYDLPQIHLARVWTAGLKHPHSKVDFNKTLELISRLHKAADSAGWIHQKIQILILESIAYWSKGNEEKSTKAIIEALKLAEPSGYVRTFIQEGECMEQMLLWARGSKKSRSYVDQLMAALKKLSYPGMNGSTQKHQALSLSDPINQLTQREKEVLERLSTSLSVKEIADQLCISVSTLRTHIKNLYRKLGVHTRRDAVRWGKNKID